MRWLLFEGAAFTPASLTGLQHRWHAVDSTKTGSPGAISQLNDMIGSLHLTQATGTRQPTDNTVTINGKVALNFDGDDALVAGAPSVSANGTVYGFIVVKVDTLVDSDALWHSGAATAANDGFMLALDQTGGSPNGQLMLNWANGTTLEQLRPATPVIGTTTPHLIEFWVIGTNGGANFAVDGVDAAGATNTVGYGTPDDMDIMARSNDLNNTDGVWCEAGLCTAVPNASNRSALLAYAQSYWGTP